jgi:hypothetical protein
LILLNNVVEREVMQKRLWGTDGIFVGAATLLTLVSTAWTKPADIKTIGINGGTAALSASGIVFWIRQRHSQTQAMLRQELRSQLRETVNTSRNLHTGQLTQTMQPFSQRLNSLEQFQTELNQVNYQLNVQWQETRDRTRILGQDLATLQPLKQQVQALRDREHQLEQQVQALRDREQQRPTATVPTIPSPRAEPQTHFTTGTPRPIKKSSLIEQFGSKQEEIVIEWLERRQLRIAPPPPPVQHVDDHYNQLALYLGDHYAVLKDFHAAMKRAMHHADDSQRNLFEFGFRNDLDFRISTKFCAELQRAFLAEGDFRPRPGRKFLKGKLAEDAVLRGFLDGKWFERFVYQKMAQTLTEKGLDHACLLNARILAPLTGKTEAELDMVFLIEGQPICIECKSGQYKQEDARKFAQYAERLTLDRPCAIFVVLEDYAADIELQKPRMETITMTASAQLGSALQTALQSMEASLAETSEDIGTVEETKADNEAAAKVLNQVKSRFRPITPQRALVWQSLTALFGPDRPQEILNFVTLKNLLAECIGISKNQINGVLLLLRNAGYFWDEQHNPVMGVGQPIHTLRSLKPEDAEQVFVEEYVKQLLKLDWSFFDEGAQCQQFAATVGVAVPDTTTLERLKQELSEGEAEHNAELTL